MKRRHALIALGSVPMAAVLGARAQTPRRPVIGILYGASSAAWPSRLAAFREGLVEMGYTEGRNVAFEIHRIENQPEPARKAADHLVTKQVALIVAMGGPQVALATKAATATIPIVFTFGGDPVRSGLVASLSRPGGNATGISILAVDLAAKLLDVFRELLPAATSVALLVNPTSPVTDAYRRATEAAAHALGLNLQILGGATGEEIDAAFAAASETRAAGLLVAADPFFEIRREQIIAAAERHRIPTFYFVREFVALGGLASYGTDFNDAGRAVGVYAGRILKGVKPSELPVLEPTKFELVINRKTARALGITIPQSLLLRADEVIQ